MNHTLFIYYTCFIIHLYFIYYNYIYQVCYIRLKIVIIKQVFHKLEAYEAKLYNYNVSKIAVMALCLSGFQLKLTKNTSNWLDKRNAVL